MQSETVEVIKKIQPNNTDPEHGCVNGEISDLPKDRRKL